MQDRTDVKHDPGWNDPPIFSYDKATAIQTSATKRGIYLNKRVAYPMTGKPLQTSISQGTSSIPPNMPQMNLPPRSSGTTVHNNCDQSEENIIKKLSTSERLDKVMKNFQLLIPENDVEEITKRIKIMETMWTDGKLDEQVQLKLIDLIEALCQNDIELADHLQKGLMVDHVSQCSSWMSGIRQLINCKRSKN